MKLLGITGRYIADRNSVAGGWNGDGAVSRSNRDAIRVGVCPVIF